MTAPEVLGLSLAEALGYLKNISPLIIREAAIQMPWDVMIAPKDRPKNVPDFFILKKRTVGDMTDAERMAAIGQISSVQAMRQMALEGKKKWEEKQKERAS